MFKIVFDSDKQLVHFGGFLRSETLRNAWLEALAETIKQDTT